MFETGHRQWRVCQKGMDLAEQVYRITARFPHEEFYGLTSQMRRSAVSVPSNVDEPSQGAIMVQLRCN